MTRTPSTVKLDLGELLSGAPALVMEGLSAHRKSLPIPPLGSPDPKTRGTVLLVEKDDKAAQSVTNLLEEANYKVIRASYIAQAKSLLEMFAADFLLARREAMPVSAETDLFLRQIKPPTCVRIVNDFTELVLHENVTADTMTRSYLAMLDFLVSQLEGNEPRVRGHSSAVARYCSLMGQRMGLASRDLDTLTAAAYLHDLDSLIAHRFLTKVTQDEKGVQLPSYERTVDQLAQIPSPFPVTKLLLAASRPKHLTDRSAEDVPLAARILRIADVYDTLHRTNPDVPEEEAFYYWMRKLPPGVFDAHALEIFIHLRKNERMLSSMDIFFAKVLIVDPRPEEVRELQLRLENNDHQVITVPTVDAAMQAVVEHNVTMVITECSFNGVDDGFRLLRTIKIDPTYQHLPVFFLSAPETAKITQAIELGAEDWFPKPTNVDIIAMKVNRMINRLKSEPNSQVEGVRGSVKDMGIIEMVQILGAANRSVRVALERDAATAELFVHKGRIIAATMGDLTGDKAAIEILLWETGRFHILPLKNAPAPNVTMSTGNLIMESCLQKDSRAVQGGNGTAVHS